MNYQLWHIVLTAIVMLFLGGLVGRSIAIFWNVAQASRIASRGVGTLLEDAAEQMIADSRQQWVVWCLHLLKAVDIRVDAQEYHAALEQIEAEIRVRLETGHWPETSVSASKQEGDAA
jgi:hypothetical protein